MQTLSFEKFMDTFSVLHKRRVGKDLVIYIGQIDFRGDSYARFVSLVIRDNRHDAFIAMRLSTFRTMISWMFAKGFTDRPRKIRFLEDLFRSKSPKRIRNNTEAHLLIKRSRSGQENGNRTNT